MLSINRKEATYSLPPLLKQVNGLHTRQAMIKDRKHLPEFVLTRYTHATLS